MVLVLEPGEGIGSGPQAAGYPPGVEEEAAGEGDEDEDDGEVELELLILVFVGKPGMGTHPWDRLGCWRDPPSPPPKEGGACSEHTSRHGMGPAWGSGP